MYRHNAASTTSLSDDGDDFEDQIMTGSGFFAGAEQPLVLSPAPWKYQHREQCKSLQSVLPSEASGRRSSPMSTIPPEVLIHILKHLHWPRDLYNALRVSRAWCSCCVELLWHKPHFAKADIVQKLSLVLNSPEQTFSYASFIRRFNLTPLGSAAKDNFLVGVERCTRLERLTLVNCENVSGEALARILPHCPMLVALDLTGVVDTRDDALVGAASAAKRLQGINLTGCRNVTDVGLMALATNCPLLRRVKLSGVSALTDAPICAMARGCPYLLELDLNQCQNVTDVAIREIWTHSMHMREIRLAHCVELTDAAFPAPPKPEAQQVAEQANPFPASAARLADSQTLPPLVVHRRLEHLRMLDVTACGQLTDDAIDGVISRAPKIRNLVLSKCIQITDRSVENICKLGRYLHYLHLGHAAHITDRAVRTLARSCTRLRYVDFASEHLVLSLHMFLMLTAESDCTHLTDMSVFELSALPKLRRVGLVRVNNLTDEAVFSLAERHATLERIHLSYCEQISAMAIHFLLQKLHKLTHLSLTGIPAFRQPELQQFCREPPKVRQHTVC